MPMFEHWFVDPNQLPNTPQSGHITREWPKEKQRCSIVERMRYILQHAVHLSTVELSLGAGVEWRQRHIIEWQTTIWRQDWSNTRHTELDRLKERANHVTHTIDRSSDYLYSRTHHIGWWFPTSPMPLRRYRRWRELLVYGRWHLRVIPAPCIAWSQFERNLSLLEHGREQQPFRSPPSTHSSHCYEREYSMIWYHDERWACQSCCDPSANTRRPKPTIEEREVIDASSTFDKALVNRTEESRVHEMVVPDTDDYRIDHPIEV